MKLNLLLSLALIAGPVAAQGITVVDDTDADIEKYEVMWHTADSGYSRWYTEKGENRPRFPKDTDVIDVVVRSEGYATTVRRFESDALMYLRVGRGKITLRRGQEVQLKLNVPEGMAVPADFLPQVFFPQFAWRVRMMWQPVNLRDGRGKPDFNFLNVTRVADRAFSFRLPREQTSFLVAIQHPGWLQFYEVGPFSNLDIKDGVLEIDVPRPGTIQVSFNAGVVSQVQLPFEDATVTVHWPDPSREGSSYSATWNERIRPGETRVFSDFGPGLYRVMLRTNAREGIQDMAETLINPGRFFARQELVLSAGEPSHQRFQWKPFDPNANSGDGHARLKLLRADGSPAGDVPLKVRWSDGHYGSLLVHEGRTPGNGTIQLNNISSAVLTESPRGPYSVELGGDTIGWFRLQPTEEIQEFEFRMAPEAGNPAPDIDIVAVDTGQAKRLSDYRGKVVVLELWATWCGPCKPAMKKLNRLANVRPEWSDRVAIIPVSVDRSPNPVPHHVARRHHRLARPPAGQILRRCGLAR